MTGTAKVETLEQLSESKLAKFLTPLAWEIASIHRELAEVREENQSLREVISGLSKRRAKKT